MRDDYDPADRLPAREPSGLRVTNDEEFFAEYAWNSAITQQCGQQLLALLTRLTEQAPTADVLVALAYASMRLAQRVFESRRGPLPRAPLNDESMDLDLIGEIRQEQYGELMGQAHSCLDQIIEQSQGNHVVCSVIALYLPMALAEHEAQIQREVLQQLEEERPLHGSAAVQRAVFGIRKYNETHVLPLRPRRPTGREHEE